MAVQPPLTRLQRAFEELRKEHRLIVEENCLCCGTCAHAECSGLLAAQPDKVGYIFYHGQDLDLAAESGTLWLGHDAREDMPQTIPALVTCECLREHGFEVEWNGDVRTRIKVTVPAGRERDYFRWQLEEQWGELEEEWGRYAGEEDEEEEEEGAEGEPGAEEGQGGGEAAGQAAEQGGAGGQAAGQA